MSDGRPETTPVSGVPRAGSDGPPEVVRAQASVNLAAIERNCGRLRGRLAPEGELCAVVKADGYGHGAVPCALAALAGGAGRLAVATAAEAVQLREGGLPDTSLLVMGALTAAELAQALAVDAEVVVWNEEQIARIEGLGGGRVHVKLDSGMGRLGTRDRAEADRTVRAAIVAPGVSVVGAMTHFATADECGDDFFFEQLGIFREWADQVKAIDPGIVIHAANSAATLREEGSHFDMVRCGIAVYGMDPFGRDPDHWDLEPALELDSHVAAVKACGVGQSAGYGRRFIATTDTTLAVLPIGYGDGLRRAASNNGDVLIEGRRYPIVGTISMDNTTVDLGAEWDRGQIVDRGESVDRLGLGPDVPLAGRSGSDGAFDGRSGLVGAFDGSPGPDGAFDGRSGPDVPLAGSPGLVGAFDGSPGLVGGRATLIGRQGSERITAEEVASRLDTINYEITCGLTGRTVRYYHRDGRPCP